MDIEHCAYTMEDPVAAAEWYSKNLGMRIVRSIAVTRRYPYRPYCVARATIRSTRRPSSAGT